jgi:hypothetical protein
MTAARSPNRFPSRRGRRARSAPSSQLALRGAAIGPTGYQTGVARSRRSSSLGRSPAPCRGRSLARAPTPRTCTPQHATSARQRRDGLRATDTKCLAEVGVRTRRGYDEVLGGDARLPFVKHLDQTRRSIASHARDDLKDVPILHASQEDADGERGGIALRSRMTDPERLAAAREQLDHMDKKLADDQLVGLSSRAIGIRRRRSREETLRRQAVEHARPTSTKHARSLLESSLRDRRDEHTVSSAGRRFLDGLHGVDHASVHCDGRIASPNPIRPDTGRQATY